MSRSIYADFQNTDVLGRVRLNLFGTMQDLLEQAIELEEGLTLVLSDGELSARGKVCHSEAEKIWVAEIEWSELAESPLE